MALAALHEECSLFASRPDSSPQLLELLLVLGVKRITALAVGLSVLLITHAGDQSAAERALHTQIVARFERDQHAMAQARAIAAS